MQEYQNYFEANKALWNQRTTVHKDSSFYDVPAFMQGKTSLTPIELNELGDVSGKKILHLQCHFGMDSLSLARMGAEVTGVDLSDASITEARNLNDQLGLNAKFICCNVYDLEDYLEEKYDIVFTTYGVVGWLPDLETWANLISHYLKPGGYFYIAEFHPVIWMFDDDFTHIKYYYQNRELIETNSTGTYTDRNAPIAAKEYSWNHSLSEVINSLLSAGLELKFLNEYAYSPYPCFNKVVQGEDGNWRIEGLEDKIPMVYSIKALKK